MIDPAPGCEEWKTNLKQRVYFLVVEKLDASLCQHAQKQQKPAVYGGFTQENSDSRPSRQAHLELLPSKMVATCRRQLPVSYEIHIR